MGIDQRFTELCVFEMLTSDNQTLEEALAAYNQSLFSGSDDDGPSSLKEMLYSPGIREILQATTSQVCPGQPACSDQGTCRDSTCTCNQGKHTDIGLLRGKKRSILYLHVSMFVRIRISPIGYVTVLLPVVSTDFNVALTAWLLHLYIVRNLRWIPILSVKNQPLRRKEC